MNVIKFSGKNYLKLTKFIAAPVWVGIGIGILEAFQLWHSRNIYSVQYPESPSYWLLPLRSAALWLPLLIILRSIFTVKLYSEKQFLSLPTRLGAFLVFYLIIFITLSSWFFFSRTGMFLAWGHLLFGMENIGAILLHFMQTGPVLLITIYLLALLIALSAVQILSKLFLSPSRLHAKLALTALVLILLAIPVHWNRRHRQPNHPWISLAGLAYGSSTLDLNRPFTMPVLREKNAPYNPGVKQNTITKAPVIVLMIESMRRDLAEIKPSPIPFIKTLIDKSFFFDKPYTPASHSNYADPSIWYAQYPLRSKNLHSFASDDPRRGTSIFQVFKSLEYKTAYISSQNEHWGNMIHWLDTPSVDYFYHSEDYQGETWLNTDDARGLFALLKKRIVTAGKIEDSETLRICRDWIDSIPKGNPFFLGLNLQNTHFNYVIPEGGVEPFQPSDINFPTVYYAWPEDRVEDVRNRYLNAFFNLDRIIQDFVAYLKGKGIWDKCWFLIVGDSGEAFHEHGFGNHSGPMYEEVIRTFCLMKPPYEMESEIVPHPVNLIDIFPALLDKMKIVPPGSFQGVSPFSAPVRKAIYLHSNAIARQDGIIVWPWKLLLTTFPAQYAELYNLENDKNETRNLFPVYPESADRLVQDLIRWRQIQVQYYSDSAYFNKYYPPRYLDDTIIETKRGAP